MVTPLLAAGLYSGVIQRTITVIDILIPQSTRLLPPEEHRRVMEASRHDEGNGMPVLYLSGNHYQMGYQHGVLARDRIHLFRLDAYRYMAELIQTAMKLPGWLARLITRPLLYWQTTAYWNTIPPEYLEEARGVADGAGVHPMEVVLVTAIWEMYLVGGCSEFVLTGRMTADGGMLHGYNYDLMAPEHALINPYLAMIFYRPADGIAFSTLNTVGSIGVNAGMSDQGLSIAWDNTHTRDGSLFKGISLPVVPFIITLRRVLEKCKTVDEGIQLVVDSPPRPLADIIIIGSAKENKATLLETAGSLHATRTLNKDAVWSTNHFRSEKLAPHDHRGDWRTFEKDAYAKTFPRYRSYEMLFAKFRGRIDPRLAVEIIRDPYPREKSGEIYHHIAHRSTICREATGFSLIMQPGEGLIWGSDGKLPAPQGRLYAFDQRAWERRPDLDIGMTGFRDALACADAYLRGDREGSRKALERATAIDGETAPLLMMRSVLARSISDNDSAVRDLQRVAARWGTSPTGLMARSWLSNKDFDITPVPFPSAIAPRIYFHGAADPGKRVRKAEKLKK
jgi:predicted choloylglycine hydrolase